MSYVVTIKRDPPITGDGLRELLENDGTLSPLTVQSTVIDGVRWQGSGADRELPLPLEEGAMWSTPRTDAGLTKMQELARKLGARVFGEEGEDLTDANVTPAAKTGCGAKAAVLLAFILLIAATAAVA
jgi:hypothetical protein